MYDIGVNLFCKQFKNPKDIIDTACKDGVTCILTGTDMKENRRIVKFIEQYDGKVYGTCGFHPHNADRVKSEDYIMQELMCKMDGIVAVGECGLDYDRMFSTQENQLKCLESQIEIAERLKMPLFLHERKAHRDFVSVFNGHKEICKNSIVHCFTGTRQQMETYLDMGFYIGITGWIADERRNQDLVQAVKYLPLDRVLIETDAPYLTPRGYRLGNVNTPSNLKYVAKSLSKYMRVSEKDLIENANKNTEKIFKIIVDEK